MIEESSFQLRSKKQIQEHYRQKEVEKVQNRISQRVSLYSVSKNLSETNLIMNALKNHFIFYNLNEAELQNIKDKMLCCVVNEGQCIYKESDVGSCFFIVMEGNLKMDQGQGKIPKEFRPSDGFGEIALLYETQRNSTVTALSKSRLWVIDRTSFREAVQEIIVKQYNQNRKYLEGVRFFSQLTYDQKDLVASTLIVQKFYKNQNIIQEGDPGSSLYYVKEGIASVYKGDKFVRKLSRGDSFGEQSLYYNTMRQYTIKADDEVTCLVLGRDTLNRILGDKIYDVTFKNFIKWSFDRNNILSKLSKEHIDKIIDNMKISSLKAHETIFKRGILGFQKVVVVIEGSLKKLKNGAVVASKGQCYGEQYLLNENKMKVLEDEIVMSTYGVIAQINSNVFYQQIQSFSLEDVLKKAEGSKKKQIKYESPAVRNSQKFQLTDFIYVDKIADGQFGQILRVRDPNSYPYCIKSYEKKSLQEYDVEKFIKDEKIVTSMLSHPFIIKNIRAFQSQKLLFLLNQYVQGQNFYQVLKKIGLLSSQDSLFYSANIIVILEYLQTNCVISRDIKPQNFMVTEEGFLKLMSLSTAKVSRSQGSQITKTFTVIGTPHYMAPDIVLGKGYDNMVDLWSLGVCMYEFFTGVLPFGDSANSSYQIYEEILQVQVRFPEFMTDKKAKKLIEQLLSHNPQQRNGGAFINLKSNPFFESINWDEFYEMNLVNIKAPFLPQMVKISQVLDRSSKFNRPMIEYLKECDKRQYPYNSKKNIWSDFGEAID